MKNIKILLILFLFSYISLAQQVWDGKITIMGMELGIQVRFDKTADSLSGQIDIPQQGAMNLALSNVKTGTEEISFTLPGPAPANFYGKYITQDSIYGTMEQAGMAGKFWLVPGILKTPVETVEEPKPYHEEEVTFTNSDILIAGTFSRPSTDGPYPTVVMITGSGPQTRDEEIVGFKIFGTIADYLTRNGIAVLRYDDRGMGKSKGPSVNESTTEDFANDVLAAVNYLKTRKDVYSNKIGLFGHSEGGIVAPLAASKDKSIAFMILMAGTGVRGIDIIKEQTMLIMRESGTPELYITEKQKFYDRVLEASEGKGSWDAVEQMLRIEAEAQYDTVVAMTKKTDINKDEFVKSYVSMQMFQMNSPWMKYFLTYDPVPVLKATTIPTLAMFGGKDLQVPPHQNEKPIRDALTEAGNTSFKVVNIPDANHLFQCAETGSPSEYAKLKKEFCPGFLEAVVNFIKEVK